MTKTLIAAAGIALFLTRGPDGCAGYPSQPASPAPATPACGLHVIGPDPSGRGKSVADAVNAQDGC